MFSPYKQRYPNNFTWKMSQCFLVLGGSFFLPKGFKEKINTFLNIVILIFFFYFSWNLRKIL